MQLNRRPKLFPPLALLAPAAGPSHRAGARTDALPLSPMELRRIVADIIG